MGYSLSAVVRDGVLCYGIDWPLYGQAEER